LLDTLCNLSDLILIEIAALPTFENAHLTEALTVWISANCEDCSFPHSHTNIWL